MLFFLHVIKTTAYFLTKVNLPPHMSFWTASPLRLMTGLSGRPRNYSQRLKQHFQWPVSLAPRGHPAALSELVCVEIARLARARRRGRGWIKMLNFFSKEVNLEILGKKRIMI